MSYRQSTFDPEAFQQPGRPLRPYNGVQRLGVALIVAGLAFDLAYFVGRLGWTRPLIGSPTLALALIFPGIALVNARREPGTVIDSEQLRRNRRVLLATVAILAAIFGAVLVIEFQGA